MTTFSEIVEKLKRIDGYPNFIRHINGNTTDNRVSNLTRVTLQDAFKHMEWKVDWVCFLTEEEVKFVKDMLSK